MKWIIAVLFLTGCNSTQSAKISLFEIEMLTTANEKDKHEKISYELTTNSDNSIRSRVGKH